MTTIQPTARRRAASTAAAAAVVVGAALSLGACSSASRTGVRPARATTGAPATAVPPATAAGPPATAVPTSAATPATNTAPPVAASPTPATTPVAATAAEVEVLADCQTPAYRPTSIITTCGDGEDQITQISWQSYTSTSAVGTGVLDGDSCNPDCAQGSPTQARGTVSLSQPVATAAGPVFAAVTFTPTGGTPTTFHPGT